MKKPDKFIPPTFDNIEKTGVRYLLYTDLFNITWQLGKFCNYSCSYCWPDCHSSVPDYKSLETLFRTVDSIKKQARERGFNSFRLSLAGGEPTLHKGFLEFISHYSKDTEKCNHQSIHVTTNLSRKKEWFSHFIKAAQPLDSVSMTTSFHREFASREEFADKVQFLLEKGVYCRVSLVMVPGQFDTLWDEADYFYNNRLINVALQVQTDSDNRVVSGYTEEMLEKLQKAFPFKHEYCNKGHWKQDSSSRKCRLQRIKDSYLMELSDSKGNTWNLDNCDKLNAFNFNQYKNWECSAGYRSLVISTMGNIRRGYSCHDKPIGHIDKNFKLPTTIEPCISPICTCTADSKIPKRKMGTTHSLFQIE